MDEVPTIELGHLSEMQRRAYVLADNRLALSAGWDTDMLHLELGELDIAGFDLALTGFDPGELAGFLVDETDGLTDPDAIPEVVSALLAGVQPHLMVTDPPYGVEYDPAWRNRAGLGNTARIGKVETDDRADWREAWALFPGDVAYVWHGALHATTVAESLTATGFSIRAQVIWAKDRLMLGRGHYHWQHEPCWYAVREGATGQWSGDRRQTTLWSIASRDQDADTVHGTQKPVACMQRPIENNSSPGQAVYEPFSGSGTTIIAAERSGRACYAVELSPGYVDVAIQRWQAFTGNEAVLEHSSNSMAPGLSFAAVSAARLVEG